LRHYALLERVVEDAGAAGLEQNREGGAVGTKNGVERDAGTVAALHACGEIGRGGRGHNAVIGVWNFHDPGRI
jgi:hypothetical protein